MSRKITEKGLENNLGNWVEIHYEEGGEGYYSEGTLVREEGIFGLVAPGVVIPHKVGTGDTLRVEIRQGWKPSYTRDYSIEL
jgi:hypothetical protein